MNDTAIPRRLGRYRVDGVLGEGSMAVVYAGFDPDIQRQVAIKCLHRDAAADPAYRRRFVVEARAAGHLNHPHIVTIFDAGETDDGVSYIAMERLSGETLSSRIARDGFPSLPVIIALVAQVAGALDYAHAQGVVHHDIKPDNIMVSDDWHHAKVNDFGIAEQRLPEQDGDSVPRTEVGGTPAYMAPEHLRGEITDARSDLFSLGVMLYWLLAGKLPWPETSDVRELVRLRRRTPQPPSQPRDPATPSILLEMVHTLLAPNAEDRYQHGAEVVDDLHLASREYERLDENALATGIISLRLRWSAILGAVLSLTLLLGLAVIYARQSAVVTGLAVDFGSSLGRMIASESAENLLLGDRAATRALVEDIARNQQIHYLAIADRHGDIIASTEHDQVGHPLQEPGSRKPLSQTGGIRSYRSRIDGGTNHGEMLLFDVPIRYQTKIVGEMRLGISDAPLRAAQKTTLSVIVAVLLITLLAVVGAVYWLSRRLLSLLDLFGKALLRVAHGDFLYRIRLVRRDELGRLFAAFNVMNSTLHDRRRQLGRAPRPARPGHVEQPTRIISVTDADEDATPPK
ncbi:MAG: serine/threonine protein kinase [Rhodanobacter sp.]|nr:MAG: serine/threonine protein kinase [Rhodanobacter sp.]